MTSRVLVRTFAAALFAFGLTSPASAVQRPAGAGGKATIDRGFDVRAADTLALSGIERGRSDRETVRNARAGLGRSLGAQGVLDVDPLTGTMRNLQRLDGALTGPASGSRTAIAMDFVRGNLSALGLTSSDLDSLSLEQNRTGADGVTHLRWSQSYHGIPAFDNDLRVHLDRGGRVISAGGAPRHALSVDSTEPGISAEAAMEALQRHVGGPVGASARSRAGGARRATSFGDDNRAQLVLFGGRDVQLAWHVVLRKNSSEVYEAVVDASDARVLYRQNIVKFASASAFEQFPGAAAGGTQTTHDITPWLTSGATTLTGPNAHAWADIDDDDTPDAGEEAGPSAGSDWLHTFTPLNPASSGCAEGPLCSWSNASAGSWSTNQLQDTTQVFFYVNNFHDHLLNPAIDFDVASGNFQGDDPVLAQADDGANSGPDGNHINNANMSTFPDGTEPAMQMFLFAGSTLRDINGGDDARIVYHEYVHGLSNRLVLHADGWGALNSVQSGAMGEAWSDFYAFDYLVREGLVTDTATTGQIDLGEYTDRDTSPNQIRFQPLDCPVSGAADPLCPGSSLSAGAGGFTYGDFGKICCGGTEQPEVHADGEIWGETLWDLRVALVGALGSDTAASDYVESLVTGGMRFSPAEPSFLDMRNAILAQETALGGAQRALIWSVFANRGMGFNAGATSGYDAAPVEDFSLPPAANAPRGTVSGTVTDPISGLPITNAFVGLPGHVSSFDAVSGDPLIPAAKVAADGTYSFSVPAGTVPEPMFQAAGYDTFAPTATVPIGAGQTLVREIALKRDWSSLLGGAELFDGNDFFWSGFGCGPGKVADQYRLGFTGGWSANNPNSPNYPPQLTGDDPYVTLKLPTAVTVTAFGMDPANACGDGASATTRGYRVETSADGVNFATAAEGAFLPADAGRINEVPPTANATNVRFVKLTLLSPQSENPGQSGRDFIDFTEFEVYGTPPNVLPTGTLAASVTNIAPGATVNFTAAFSDPDSLITGYDWDFDGNGTTDASTAGPTASSPYPNAGNFLAKVSAKDFRGGAGTATAAIAVAAPVVVAPVTKAPKARISICKKKNARKARCRFKVTFGTGGGSVSAKLTLSKKNARKIGVKKRSAGTLKKRSFGQAGVATITFKLLKKAVKAAKARGVKKVKLTLSVTATNKDGVKTTLKKAVTIRL